MDKKEKKKLARAKKRKQAALARKDPNESGEDNEEDSSATESQERGQSSCGATSCGEEARLVKKVYGAARPPSEYVPDSTPVEVPLYGPSDTIDHDPEQKAPKAPKQHHGLRCLKCFLLLCRDDDFEYRNGQLWVSQTILRSGWEGLVVQGGKVFCKNMHQVGFREASTWTDKTRYSIILKIDKTTFTDNFVNNLEFVGSDKIKNKLKHAEDMAAPSAITDFVLKRVHPDIIKSAREGASVPDRYHS